MNTIQSNTKLRHRLTGVHRWLKLVDMQANFDGSCYQSNLQTLTTNILIHCLMNLTTSEKREKEKEREREIKRKKERRVIEKNGEKRKK